MIRKSISVIVICYFLTGSLILPLGDFALIKELPQMYNSYKKVASANEAGLADFVGDYLLGGKAMFGHNKQDAPETSPIKFQHDASFCSLITLSEKIHTILFADTLIGYINVANQVNTSEFHPELFRPPSPLA